MASLAQAVERGVRGLADRRAVFLPDLYVDLFVPLGGRAQFQGQVDTIAGRGGGNLVSPGHGYRVGGDATNTAYALARLGVPCALIAPVDTIGRGLVEEAARGIPLDLSLLLPSERSSSTVALEFREARGASNVMLSDPGPLETFGPERLSDAAWSAIESADVVGVMNWSQNRRAGSALLRAVLPRARRAGAFTYMDTSDPRHRAEEGRALVADGTIMEHLSAWAMNEQEVAFFAAAATGAETREVARGIEGLRTAYPGRIDVHTERDAWSASGDRVVRVAAPKAEPLFRTGAGNAWNAGNVLGTLLGLADEDRLRVAHAVAVLTITAGDRRPPDVQSLVRHLSKT